jgi:uncharacterized Tic20 family protein
MSDEISKDDRNLAMLAHLLGIVTGFLASLIIWLIHKDNPEKAFVSESAKEALNFQITILIVYFVCGALAVIFIGFLLLPLVWVGNLVFCILAGVAASKGEAYRYPLTLRLLQ